MLLGPLRWSRGGWLLFSGGLAPKTAPCKLQLSQSNPQSPNLLWHGLRGYLGQRLATVTPLAQRQRVSGLSRNLAHLIPLLHHLVGVGLKMTGVGGGLRLGFLLGFPSLFPQKIRVSARQGKHPMVQSTKPHNKHAPLSLSAPGYSSGWFLLAPLHQHLVLRFLEAPRFRCHPLTVDRPRLNTLAASTQKSLPHALSQSPRLYS